jgi:hypothetical protein
LTLDANSRLSNVAVSAQGAQFNLFANAQSSGEITLAQGFSTATDNVGYLFNRSNAAFVFGTNNTERARITAGGVFIVGTTGLPTANGSAMSLSGSAEVARIYGTTEATGPLFVEKSTNTSTTSQVFVMFTINGQATGSGQINANGASQVAFGSFSDRRLKDNITDLASQWANIKALRPVEFDYIASEGGGHQIGFVFGSVMVRRLCG